jgi:hypothetical protein
MPYDYTDAPPPPEIDLISPGTIATVSLLIKPGNVGEDGMLTRSKDGGCEMLVCECTVVDGPHAKRKFWPNLILEGTTDGHAGIAATNRLTLKAILDSAYGLKPKDESAEARAVRTVSLKQFNGVTFMAKIGIEKGKSRENIVEFLLKAMPLIRKAMLARDLSERGVTRKSSAATIARQTNAAAGGPLMTPDELNDEIGL